MKKIVIYINWLEDVFICVTFSTGIGLIFIGIVARYLFNRPITFIDELSTIILVWGIIVGYSVVLRNDEHVKMDAFFILIRSEKIKKGIQLIGYIAGILYSSIIFWYGWKAVKMQYKMSKVTNMLEVPTSFIYIVIPFIGIVMIIRHLLLIKSLFITSPSGQLLEGRKLQ